MTSISEKIPAFILKHGMLAGSRGAVVAVSGGPDSVAILDVLVRLLNPTREAIPHSHASAPCAEALSQFGVSVGFSLTVAHLNHKLRVEASDEDAQFVCDLARRLGLAAIIGVADVKSVASKFKMGIEEAARAARYCFLSQAARLASADRIVTGHTMNDQVETFIMRAVRGAGAAGLAGMAAVRPEHQFDRLDIAIDYRKVPPAGGADRSPPSDGPTLLIRPALCVTREEIELYCRERSLGFRVDASNLGGEFTRNRLRHEVISGLCSVEPQAVRSIARAMKILAIDNEALEQLAELALDQAGQATGAGNRWPQTTGLVLDVDVLSGQPQAILNRAIIRSVRRFMDKGHEITSTHVSAVEALIRSGRSGKHLELPGNVRAWREGRSLVIDNLTNACQSFEIELNDVTKAIRAGGFLISLERNLPLVRFEDLLGRAISEKRRSGRNWGMAVLDDRLLPDKLIVRPRRPGERAHLIGQSGPNKLKNLMINHKIPVRRRAFWPLAATLEGRYVWSPGLPPSVEFAVNRETRALAILSATDN